MRIRILTSIGLVLLSACALNKDPAKNSSRAQFLDEVWVAPNLQGKAPSQVFQNVFFPPVMAGRLKEQGWWASQSPITQRQLEEDSYRLAAYLQKCLVQEMLKAPDRKFNIVTEPTPDTVIVQLAITELVPAKAFWNAASTAAGFVVPGAGLLGAAGAGSVTVVGQLYDGNTGEQVVGFQNKMKDKKVLINIDSYSWFTGSEKNLEEMAAKTVQILNAPADTVIKESSPVKFAAF